MTLSAVFESLREAGRVGFVPYVVAGDPDLETTDLVLQTLVECRADVIELGVPYGDPIADGPTIAAASARALRRGVSLNHVFGLVQRHRQRSDVPVVLFTYYNPLEQYGVERFAAQAVRAGAAGAIVPDLSLEEAGPLRETMLAHHLELPLLVAPSTPLARAARIAQAASGFIYVVSRFGVTGAAAMPLGIPQHAVVLVAMRLEVGHDLLRSPLPPPPP